MELPPNLPDLPYLCGIPNCRCVTEADVGEDMLVYLRDGRGGLCALVRDDYGLIVDEFVEHDIEVLIENVHREYPAARLVRCGNGS